MTTLKRYFLPAAISFIFVAFCGIAALAAIIDRSIGGMLIIAAALAVSTAVSPAFARKPGQPPNDPRIEHLPIAGKFTSAGASKAGTYPLHLER